MYEKASYEFALLGEHLNPVVAAFADVHEAVGGDVNAVQRGCELLLIGRRTCLPIIRRGGIVADVRECLALSPPASLE